MSSAALPSPEFVCLNCDKEALFATLELDIRPDQHWLRVRTYCAAHNAGVVGSFLVIEGAPEPFRKESE